MIHGSDISTSSHTYKVQVCNEDPTPSPMQGGILQENKFAYITFSMQKCVKKWLNLYSIASIIWNAPKYRPKSTITFLFPENRISLDRHALTSHVNKTSSLIEPLY
jgi:hypothetical protein